MRFGFSRDESLCAAESKSVVVLLKAMAEIKVDDSVAVDMNKFSRQNAALGMLFSICSSVWSFSNGVHFFSSFCNVPRTSSVQALRRPPS